MRFLADENASRLVIERLRADGFEVSPSNAAEADAVAEVVSNHADKLVGNLVVIEPGRVRVRPLPR